MALKRLTLRRDDMCAHCSTPVWEGSTAWWDGPSRSVFCADCEPSQRVRPLPRSNADRADRAAGERRLARRLDMEVPEDAAVLHDRQVPGARGKAHHIVIAPTGIWLIDAKHFTGRVRRRNVGGWISSGERLFVGNHNRTKLIDAMSWQVVAVRAQLDPVGHGEVAVRPVMCLTNAQWGRFARPFHVDGVLVAWPGALVTAIATDDRVRMLDAATVEVLAHHLGSSLPVV